jgi:hypothetical protein
VKVPGYTMNNDKPDYRRYPGREDAFTGLELVIVAATVILFAAVSGYFLITGTGSAAEHRGYLPEALSMSGDHLRTVGSVFGFSAVDTFQDGISIRFQNPDRDRLGAAQLSVALFTGHSEGLDMSRARILWMTDGNVEELSRTSGTILICPNWTIARKTSILPGQTADADTILEENEQFVLLICPSGGALPYQQFTIAVSPAGNALPLPVSLTAPASIQPVMRLN